MVTTSDVKFLQLEALPARISIIFAASAKRDGFGLRPSYAYPAGQNTPRLRLRAPAFALSVLGA
jgi:hypothetical protein